MADVRAVAAAMKGNLGPGNVGLDWWGKVTAVSSGPPPTVSVSLRGLAGSVITCRVGAGYLAQVPAIGDTVFGRQDQRGDYWCVDRIATSAIVGNAAYVGVVASGGPASGTWLTGAFGFDAAGREWFCTTGGTPGTWVSPSPWGTLGYAQVTANQSGITATTDLTGLSVPVNVGAGRRIRITGYAIGSATSTATFNGMNIQEGSTAFQLAQQAVSSTIGQITLTPIAVIKPTAGLHTYKLTQTGTGGSVGIIAGVALPAFILVEDIGV